MADNELIDKWIKKIAEHPDGFYADRLFYPSQTLLREESKKLSMLLALMETEKIIKIAVKPNSSYQKYWYNKGDKFSEIIADGGWIEYKRLQAERQLQKEAEKSEQKELNQLQRENLINDNERFRYDTTIREQEQRIRDLTEELSGLDIYRHYWIWLLTGLILIGYLIGAGSESKLHLLQNLLGLQ